MHLDDRAAEAAERVGEDDARVGQPTGVDDATCAAPALGLEDVDHRALVVGLLAANLEAARRSTIADGRLDLGERDRSIDVGLVEQEDPGHGASTAASAPRTSASGTFWPVRGCPLDSRRTQPRRSPTVF